MLVAINAGTLKQMLFAVGFKDTNRIGSQMSQWWNVSPHVASSWLTSKTPPFKAEDFVRSMFEDMAEVVGLMRDATLDCNCDHLLVRTYPQKKKFDLGDVLPTTTRLDSPPWWKARYHRAIEYLAMLEFLNPSGVPITAVPTHKWPGEPDEFFMHAPADWKPGRLPALVGKVRPLDHDAWRDFTDLAGMVEYLRNHTLDANGGLVYIRSHTAKETPFVDLSGPRPDPHRYNRALQHLLMWDYLEPSGANITVIANRRWPTNRKEIVLTLPRSTPMYAVMHRDPTNAYIDLCLPLEEDDNRPPIEGSDQQPDGSETLTSITTLRPEHVPEGDDLGGTGLWQPSAASKVLAAHGWENLEDWRLSGGGHPVGTTTIVPTDVYALQGA